MRSGERTGVYICHCGTNIAGTVDVEGVAAFVSTLDRVAVARHYPYMCSDPGQDLIKQDVREQGLTRVVVASCSPLMHEHTFRGAIEEAGLNPFLFQMANIREQCSWVTEDGERATEKAKGIVAAAVRRVQHHEPLEVKEVPVNPAALVVGGGLRGSRRRCGSRMRGGRCTWWSESRRSAGTWRSCTRPFRRWTVRLEY